TTAFVVTRHQRSAFARTGTARGREGGLRRRGGRRSPRYRRRRASPATATGGGRLAHMAVLIPGDIAEARVNSARERKGTRVGTLCGASPGSCGLAQERTLEVSDQPPALAQGESPCLLKKLLYGAHGGARS